MQIAMDDRVAVLVNNWNHPETCAQQARNPSPHFYNALKVAIKQNSRAWLQRQVLDANTRSTETFLTFKSRVKTNFFQKCYDTLLSRHRRAHDSHATDKWA